MKKFLIIISIICLALSTIAQPPEKMNYQAVIRNSNNELITNQEVTIKINIRQNAADGIVVYTETQTVTTNVNGLVTMEIGNEPGFGNINWSNGNYYIQIEADPTGGTNYTISGVSQLLSVPYALHSKTTSQSITETDPVYSASDAASITITHLNNWNTAFGWGNHADAGYLTAFTESDPTFTSHPSYNLTATLISNWDSAYSWGNHAEMGYLTSITAESDPVFTSSDVYGVTTSDIINWNTAYNWGDHSTQGYLTTFTESDPDFSSSAASGISSTNISNWNSAFGWGDHSIEGYLTSFTESDPIFDASAASNISSTNISNWNTAYSWGNHATQGYLTSFSETDPYSVHLTGNQTISGEKTFDSRTNILQIEVSPVNTGNRYGYIDFHGDNTYTDYALRLIRNNSGVNAESWLKHRGTGALYIAAEDAGKIGLRTNGNTRMYIDSNGEIGVGTTAPGAKFEVNSAGYSGSILFQVKDNAGNPVFTVYPDAVEVSVPDDGTKANKHGAFIVSGRQTKDNKATTPITRITKENYLIGHNVATAITGTKNTIYGYEAGKSLTSGSNNVLIGFETGYTTNASYSVFIGNRAGRSSTGSNNIFIGNDAGRDNGTAIRNVMIGDLAGAGATGSYTTFLGYFSGVNSSGNYCTYLGSNSGRYIDGTGNTYLGYKSGYNSEAASKSATNNVFLGYLTGQNAYGTGNVFIGANVGQSIGVNNQLRIDNSTTSAPLIFGDFSANEVEINGRLGINKNPSSSYILDANGAINASSYSNTSGSYYGLAGSLGYISMPATGEFIYKRNGVSSLVVSSNYDVGIGDATPSYRLDVYDQVGSSTSSGYISKFWNDNNSIGARGLLIFAGPDGGSSSGTGYYISIDDGNGSFVGNIYSSNGVLQIAAKSPSKGKNIIKNSSINASEIISKLGVVDFKFNTKNETFQTGFVGEDAIKIFPQMVDFDREAEEYTISNSALVPILTKAIQEQQKKIEEIDQLKKEIEELKQMINQLTKQ